MPAVLFVCSANQFRSPIAAACLKKIVRQSFPDEQWTIGSAGTWAEEGLSAPPITQEAAQAHALGGLEQHITRQVNAKLLSGVDLVIVMETGHKEALRFEFPEVAGYLFQLSELVDNLTYDIVDPVKQEINPQESAQTLVQLVTRGSQTILELARQLHDERTVR